MMVSTCTMNLWRDIRQCYDGQHLYQEPLEGYQAVLWWSAPVPWTFGGISGSAMMVSTCTKNLWRDIRQCYDGQHLYHEPLEGYQAVLWWSAPVPWTFGGISGSAMMVSTCTMNLWRDIRLTVSPQVTVSTVNNRHIWCLYNEHVHNVRCFPVTSHPGL